MADQSVQVEDELSHISEVDYEGKESLLAV